MLTHFGEATGRRWRQPEWAGAYPASMPTQTHAGQVPGQPSGQSEQPYGQADLDRGGGGPNCGGSQGTGCQTPACRGLEAISALSHPCPPLVPDFRGLLSACCRQKATLVKQTADRDPAAECLPLSGSESPSALMQKAWEPVRNISRLVEI